MNLAELPMSFDTLGLAEPLLRAVHEAGYTTPTPIQAQAIPAVLSGGDLMGGAQTGTGKTAGFVLPMLQRLMAQARRARRARQAADPRPHPDADARARRAGRGKRAHLRQALEADQHGDVRRRRHAAADRQAAPRRRHPRRHAGPPARPPRPAHARPLARRDLRARRGRSHARHGLHPRHQEGARGAAAEEAEPALLGDLQRRDQGARRPPAERAGADRGRAPQPDRRARRAEGAPGRPRDEEGPADPSRSRTTTGTRCSSSRA